MPSESETPTNAPSLGGARRQRPPKLWADLLSDNALVQVEAAQTIQALESEVWYAHEIMGVIATLLPQQRAVAGDALSLLGDVRLGAPYYGSEMLYVPAGAAVIGSREYRDEQPVHPVEVRGFALAQYPVTQAAYAAFVQDTRHAPPRGWHHGRPNATALNAPVMGVSARDAEAYCAWLNDRTGFQFRLPTEAEWILAARGSGEARTYPWGDEYDARRANVWDEASPRRLCAVGLYPEGRGPYGHDDLAGNVWEWCSSLHWPYPYNARDGRENPESGEPRTMHGGSWRSRAPSARCAARQGERPTDKLNVVGFRIARDASHG